jgi:CO/xanthine dehydrogenase Mo-binding subunit
VTEYRYLGKRLPPVDGWERATGRADYVTDVKLPGMLHGKTLRSPLPHARIVRIDTSRAAALPGVKAVVTFADTPGVAFGPIPAFEDWYIFAKDKVRFVGEEVAAVAATDEATASKALDLIDVEYEELPAVFDPREAMKEGAPSVNGREGNTVVTFKVERGDVDGAFAAADLVLEEDFHTSQTYHAYLEPFAAVVRPERHGCFTMWLPIQIPNKARITYGKALGVRAEDIRIIKPHMGGAFGAKMETNLHLACAVLARKTGMPVRMVNTRREDIEATNPRVPMWIHLKMGFMRDGRIVAKEVEVIGANGARTLYAIPIVSTACYRVDTFYTFQNVRAKGYTVDTNTVPTSAFRGFGNAQMTFALETMVDMAAERLGIDRVSIRARNAVPSGYVSCHGWEVGTSGFVETLEHAAEMSDFEGRRTRGSRTDKTRHGVGLASCNHVSGNKGFFPTFDGASSIVRIGEDGKATVFHGECDMGQGQTTAFAMLAAEALGARLEDVTIAVEDTQIAPFGLGSFATRGTTVGGMGIKMGAEAARELLLQAAAEQLGLEAADLGTEGSEVFVKTDPEQRVPFAKVARDFMFSHGGMPLVGVGNYVPETVAPDPVTKYGNISPAYVFGTHVAEVEVDTETGEVEVTGYWASHDVGLALNPLLLEGQVQGGVAMGIGWTLSEDMIVENGKVLNTTLLDYRVPGAKDVPRVECDWVEPVDPRGPFGAKGIGEPALNPVPAAVANAIYDAIGIRFTELPISPERVLFALKAREAAAKAAPEAAAAGART